LTHAASRGPTTLPNIPLLVQTKPVTRSPLPDSRAGLLRSSGRSSCGPLVRADPWDFRRIGVHPGHPSSGVQLVSWTNPIPPLAWLSSQTRCGRASRVSSGLDTPCRSFCSSSWEVPGRPFDVGGHCPGSSGFLSRPEGLREIGEAVAPSRFLDGFRCLSHLAPLFSGTSPFRRGPRRWVCAYPSAPAHGRTPTTPSLGVAPGPDTPTVPPDTEPSLGGVQLALNVFSCVLTRAGRGESP
jgi:hypothetical protein